MEIRLKRRLILGITMAMAALVVLTGSVLAASSFTNGSFEGGPAANYTTLASGSTAIPSWIVTGTDVDSVRNDLWPAADGSYSVDLNGYGPGGVEQTFATNANSMYVVQFWMSGNPGDCVTYNLPGTCSPADKAMTVHATGGPTNTYHFNTADKGNTLGNMMWADEAYSFKATSATTTLSFASTIAGAYGPAIDAVTITETVATGAQCKNDGWQNMFNSDGVAFKNQGACVSFYAKSGATPIGPAA